MKGTAQPLDSLHAALARAYAAHGPERAFGIFDLLCDDPECSQCAAIICPKNHPMHTHHDGCPACAGLDVEYEDPAPVFLTSHADGSVTLHEFTVRPAPGQRFAVVGADLDTAARTLALRGKFSQFGVYPVTMGQP